MRVPAASRRAFLIASLPGFVAISRGEEEEVSDDLLYDRVNRRLITDPDLGARQLQVKVEQGVVTVSGFVESEKMQKKVEKVVKKVKGVKKIVNETKVRVGL